MVLLLQQRGGKEPCSIRSGGDGGGDGPKAGRPKQRSGRGKSVAKAFFSFVARSAEWDAKRRPEVGDDDDDGGGAEVAEAADRRQQQRRRRRRERL